MAEVDPGLPHGSSPWAEGPRDDEQGGGYPIWALKRAGMAEKIENSHWGSTLNDFLRGEGIYEEVTTGAIKKVIAWQLAEEMKKKSITKKHLAELMHTSRVQIDRILDPDKGNVTLETLQRAASLLGRQLRLELV
jgi:DNA-binding Xre family transcriptional regulator